MPGVESFNQWLTNQIEQVIWVLVTVFFPLRGLRPTNPPPQPFNPYHPIAISNFLFTHSKLLFHIQFPRFTQCFFNDHPINSLVTPTKKRHPKSEMCLKYLAAKPITPVLFSNWPDELPRQKKRKRGKKRNQHNPEPVAAPVPAAHIPNNTSIP